MFRPHSAFNFPKPTKTSNPTPDRNYLVCGREMGWHKCKSNREQRTLPNGHPLHNSKHCFHPIASEVFGPEHAQIYCGTDRCVADGLRRWTDCDCVQARQEVGPPTHESAHMVHTQRAVTPLHSKSTILDGTRGLCAYLKFPSTAPYILFGLTVK